MSDTKQYFNLSYESREEETNDILIDLTLRFENPKSDAETAAKFNSWLKAIGVNLKVVSNEKV